MNLFILFVLLSPVYSQYPADLNLDPDPDLLTDPNLAAGSNFLANPNLLADSNLPAAPNLLADGYVTPSSTPPTPQNRPWEWVYRNVLGEPCRYRSLLGTYTLELDCQNDVTLVGVWSKADNPEQDIRCCIPQQCSVDDKYNPNGKYSCLNTYKQQNCFGGVGGGEGRLVRHLCPDLPADVQCCVEDERRLVVSPAAKKLLDMEMPRDDLAHEPLIYPQDQTPQWP